MNADRADSDRSGESGLLREDVTEAVIGAFFEVYNSLGHGFLESVYEQALALEIERKGLRVERQKQLEVRYRDEPVGIFRLDLLVEDAVIVEIKAAEALCRSHEAQLINYLKASGLEVGLLLNFGPKAEFRRRILASRRATPPT